MEITVPDVTSIAIAQCVPVVGGERYTLDVMIWLQTQGQAEGRAGVVARWYAGDDCTQELPDPPASTFLTFAPDWTRQGLTPTSPSEAKSSLIELRATMTSGSGGSTLIANLDDPFFAFLGSPDCGDPTCSHGQPSANDALFVLRAAVGSLECEDCYCDVDASGEVTVSDALTVLRASVDLPVTLACPACG